MTEISPHIAYIEVVRSQTAIRKGIDNTPNEEQLRNIRKLAEKIFEPLREIVSKERGRNTPLGISSFFRAPAHNKAIGGSETSQHCKGQAVDLDIDGYYNDLDNADLFYIIEENLEFDQLIWEFGTAMNPDWVHVSYNEGNNRREILRSVSVDGKTKYELF